MRQEFRVLFAIRVFVVLLLFGVFHVAFRVLQIVAVDTMVSDPRNPLTMMLRQIEIFSVNPQTFFDFLRIQSPLVFLVCLFAGSGLICDDVRHNLMEIYFSKPLTWRDYVLGKTMTLVLLGLSLTAIPGSVLLVLHNLLAPSWKTFSETAWLIGPIWVFSLVIVLPCALGILASSALATSQRYATIAVFLLLFVDLTVGQMVSGLLRARNFLVLAFPMAINHIGEALFRAKHMVFNSHWGWSALFVISVCGVSLWIVCARVRRAEVAA